MPTSQTTRSAAHPPVAELRARAAEELGIEVDRVPHHIAVIMDGNGRWAKARGLRRLEGHRAGAESARAAITESRRLGIEVLTLYSFSSENWKRPAEEIDGLMALAVHHLAAEREQLLRNDIRLHHIGRRDPLPKPVLDELDATMAATRACRSMHLVIALNYGSRTEITDAVRAIARGVKSGEIDPDSIDEAMISQRLYTAALPDPDLLVRTADERRLSNYLLWQLSYAEIHVTDTLWPDFREHHLHEAVRDYASRQRRFGEVAPANSPQSSRDDTEESQRWQIHTDADPG